MTSVEILNIITSLLGGLALFLFGMDTMSDSLGQMTGGLLSKLTSFISKNRLSAFLFGTGITALVQSSSAISVLSVGLVNAGIIELEKAVGLLIGANLGTTATSWVLSLNAVGGQSLLMTLIKPSSFSPFLAIIGVAIYIFVKSPKAKTTGLAILGFSVMMIGMNMMSTGVSPLKDVPALRNMLVSFSNPILGFVASLLFTMLIQSSDASIGIVQAFALSVGVTFGSAIPLICGAHVGTCITALLSALGTSNNGKRTAFMSLYYNLLKTLPLMLVFYLLNMVFHFGFLDRSVGAIGIPMMHTLINMIGALIWLPGAKLIVALARKTIPFSEEEKEEQANTLAMLDPLLLSAPAYALNLTEDAVNLLAETVGEAINILMHTEKTPDFGDAVFKLCKRAEMYKNQISQYLTDISSANTLEEEAPKHSLLVNANAALGQIGAITMNVLEKTREIVSGKPDLRESLLTETMVFGEAVSEIIDVTTLGLRTKEPLLYTTIQMYHEEISRMSTALLLSYIDDMHREGYDIQNRALVANLLYTEERLIDCCDIIADALLKYSSATGKKAVTTDAGEEVKRRRIRALFEDKYEMLGLTQYAKYTGISAGAGHGSDD